MIHPRRALFELLEALAARRKAVGAVAAVIGAMAAVALSQMPLQLLPEIRYPHVRIIGDLPGQTSRVVEESVNEPIEAALAGMSGLVQVASRSGDGRAYFELFFEPGYDMDRALRDVTQAVQRAQAQIPAEMPPLRIFEVTTTQQPALELAFGSPAMSAEELRARLRASVLPRLRALAGVDAVFMGHQEIMELVVEVDPDSQAALGLRLDELETLLWEATAPPLASPMRSSHFDGVGVLGADTWTPQHLQDRVLLLDGGQRAVPLRAVANVLRAPSQEGLRTRLDGHAAVPVTIYRSPRAHSTRLAREVHAVVEEVSRLPAFATVDATTLFDDSVVTRGAVQSVVVAAVGGAVLATLLLFVALRRQRRYVPLVAAVVGVSLAAAVVVLYGMGMSLNLLTLAGLLLSVGLGLDYAIIYFDRLDRIHRRCEQPHLQAMVDVAGPLLGALLTTLAAVLPFLLVQGLIAALFRPLIWTVAICGVFAFVFAVILLPVFTRPPAAEGAPAPEGAHAESGTSGELALPIWWRRAQHPLITLALVAVLGTLAVFSARDLPFEVLPVVDDGFVDMTVSHPVGITVDEMDAISRAVEEQVMRLDGTASLFTTVGGYFREGLPAFRPARTDFMVRLDTRRGALPSVVWAENARAAIAALQIAELSVSITLPRIRGVQTRLADADVIVVLTSEDGDLLALSEIEGMVVSRLGDVAGLTGVQRLRGGVSSRWVAEPDYEALADYGVGPEALKQLLDYALEGRVLRQRMQGGEPLALRARYDRRAAGGPQHLEEMRIRTVNGREVHLGEVVGFRLVEEPTHIERREGQRVIRVSAQLDPAGPGPGVVAERVAAAMAEVGLPEGVSWWLEGEVDALEETRRTFGIALALALVLVLMLFVVQYESLSFAMAGLVSIVLSGTGTVFLLALMGLPLNAMVLAGLLISVGIVANSVILVLSQARDARAIDAALPLREALQRAARDRFRPITLTVLSTVLGISPLLWGGAEVFGLLQPLAVALTGTLLLSIVVACLILPGLAVALSPRAARSGSAQ